MWFFCVELSTSIACVVLHLYNFAVYIFNPFIYQLCLTDHHYFAYNYPHHQDKRHVYQPWSSLLMKHKYLYHVKCYLHEFRWSHQFYCQHFHQHFLCHRFHQYFHCFIHCHCDWFQFSSLLWQEVKWYQYMTLENNNQMRHRIFHHHILTHHCHPVCLSRHMGCRINCQNRPHPLGCWYKYPHFDMKIKTQPDFSLPVYVHGKLYHLA